MNLLGLKALRLGLDGLCSPLFPETHWPKPGPARCAYSSGEHEIPHREHFCGYHSAWTVGPVIDSMRFSDCLWTVVLVENFGRIVVHEEGMRSERSEVLSVVKVPWFYRHEFLVRRGKQIDPLLVGDMLGLHAISLGDAHRMIAERRQEFGV